MLPSDLADSSSLLTRLFLRASRSTSTEPLLASFRYVSLPSSNEIDLGDDEILEAIIAMIRYIYDLPYDKVLEGKPLDDTSAYITKDDLAFYIAEV